MFPTHLPLLSGRHRKSTGRGETVVRRCSLLITVACLAVATVGASAAAPALHAPTARSAAGASTPTYLVLMVLDGARPDYFGLTSLPHVNALRSGGTQFTNAIAGILEAETPAGHATISTGSRPDRNGILGFDWANDNDRYSLFAPDKMAALEQILQHSQTPTLAGLYKRQHPKAKVVALSGHKYYAAAPLGGPSADAIMYFQGDPKGRYVAVAVPGHVPPAGVLNAPGVTAPTTHLPDGGEDNHATTLALASVARMHPRMLLINYPEFDWPLGHVDGGILNRAKVITDMKGFDTDLGRIEAAYQKAGILNKTLFVITADHGMMPIKRFVPASVITNAITKAGTTAPDIARSSGDYIWLTNAAKGQAVAQNIMGARDPGIQSVYYLSLTRGKPQYMLAPGSTISRAVKTANQYLLNALLNGHEPSVVVFGREGISFSDPKTGWKADHGGNSWQSQHIPLIMAGPGIRAHVVTKVATQMDDIAPTVLSAMGVKPTGMEGHVLTGVLRHPTPALQSVRAAETRWLSPDVNALRALDGLQAGSSSR